MSNKTEMHILPADELTIVPCPQRDAWALVNRQGDTLAIGAYNDCVRHMGRLTAVAS